MYNGIGLTTPRGSGTSGYVQKNLSTLNKSKQKKHEERTEEDIARMEAALNRPPNQDILQHEKKRRIEAKLFQVRVRLEDEGLPEEEIEKRLEEVREELTMKAQKESLVKEHKFELDERGRPVVRETHELAELNAHRNDKLKKALGISMDFKEGSSMRVLNKDTKKSADVETTPASETVPSVPRVETSAAASSTTETDITSKRYRIIEDSSDSEEETDKRKKSDSKKRLESKSSEHERSVSPPVKYRKVSRESDRKGTSKKRSKRSRRSPSPSPSDSSRSSSSDGESSSSSHSEDRSSRKRRKKHHKSRSSDRKRGRGGRSPRRDRRRSRSPSNGSRERRPASPNFREARRITSARRRPIPYSRSPQQQLRPSSTETSSLVTLSSTPDCFPSPPSDSDSSTSSLTPSHDEMTTIVVQSNGQ